MQHHFRIAFFAAALVCALSVEEDLIDHPVQPHQVQVDAVGEVQSLEDTEEVLHSLGRKINVMRNSMSVAEQAPTSQPATGNETEMAERREAAPGPHPLLAGFLLCLLAVGGAVANNIYMRGRKKPAQEGEEGEGAPAEGEDVRSTISDSEELTAQGLPEDTYGMAVASLVRDVQHIAKASGSSHYGLRVTRIVTSLALLYMNMLCQIFLLVCIANLSCASAVMTIRKGYDEFEKHMYGGNIYVNANGMSRGLDAKYFKPDNFATLSEDNKGVTCKIPFSQPNFLFLILFIWTLSIIGELRAAIQLFNRLVVKTETADSMANATEDLQDEEVVIKRLTNPVKMVITFFIVVPRFVITVVLLWMGSRWLAATTDFQNLVLNSVGLEFVMLLKDLMYNTLVPDRSKRDTCRMMVNVAPESTPPSPMSFLGSFLWGFGACVWVILYIHSLQQVLPEYRWDVQAVCAPWMEENYASLR